MTTSMYISAERIQVLQGKLQKNNLFIHNVFEELLPEGTVINGVITNEAAMTRALVNIGQMIDFKKQFVDLVVDSSSILTKRLCVPFLSEKKLLSLAKDEFGEVQENYDQLLYDFSVIARKNPEGEGGIILCAAMENAFAFSYIDIFNKMKIKLHSLDIAANAAIGLVGFMPELKEKSFILAVFQSNMLVLTLFVRGQYVCTNHLRFLAERGSEELMEEICQGVVTFLPQLRKLDAEIEGVYFCNSRAEEEQLLMELSEEQQVSFVLLPDCALIQAPSKGDYKLANSFYATGNLLLKDPAYQR